MSNKNGDVQEDAKGLIGGENSGNFRVLRLSCEIVFLTNLRGDTLDLRKLAAPILSEG